MLTRFFLRQERARARRRGQAHHRRALARLTRLRLPRQRAPAREPLPLADRDGAGAGGRGQGPAARIARRAGRAGCHRACRRRPSRAAPRRRRLPRRQSPPAAAGSPAPAPAGWPTCEREARALLEAGEPEVWDTLTRQFEARLIQTALDLTRGRRIEAAQRAGHRPQHHHPQDPGTGPGGLTHASGAGRRQPSSTTTGAWSLGRSFLRGALSMAQACTRGCSASLTRMWSMRRPWFLRKARLR